MSDLKNMPKLSYEKRKETGIYEADFVEKLSKLAWEMQKPKNKQLYKYNKRRIRHVAAWCIVLTGGTDNV